MFRLVGFSKRLSKGRSLGDESGLRLELEPVTSKQCAAYTVHSQFNGEINIRPTVEVLNTAALHLHTEHPSRLAYMFALRRRVDRVLLKSGASLLNLSILEAHIHNHIRHHVISTEVRYFSPSRQPSCPSLKMTGVEIEESDPTFLSTIAFNVFTYMAGIQ
ncbi:hypothetical protein BDZ89DRAFT_1152042 [Hymenopellis radicata]|nr:hypothetical protein BDZ89DRAFT_1152042 [Hymenopellis radicata]